MSDLAQAYTDIARQALAEGLAKIEHCLSQLNDAQVWWRPRPEMNSIANLVLHLSGNMRQWIISGIGGTKDVRDRPKEFSDDSRRPTSEILSILKRTVDEVDSVLGRVGAPELTAPRRIQGFDTNALAAAFDSISHFRGHVQEIIHMTRVQLGEFYNFKFIPQGPEQTSAGAP